MNKFIKKRWLNSSGYSWSIRRSGISPITRTLRPSSFVYPVLSATFTIIIYSHSWSNSWSYRWSPEFWQGGFLFGPSRFRPHFLLINIGNGSRKEILNSQWYQRRLLKTRLNMTHMIWLIRRVYEAEKRKVWIFISKVRNISETHPLPASFNPGFSIAILFHIVEGKVYCSGWIKRSLKSCNQFLSPNSANVKTPG